MRPEHFLPQPEAVFEEKNMALTVRLFGSNYLWVGSGGAGWVTNTKCLSPLAASRSNFNDFQAQRVLKIKFDFELARNTTNTRCRDFGLPQLAKKQHGEEGENKIECDSLFTWGHILVKHPQKKSWILGPANSQTIADWRGKWIDKQHTCKQFVHKLLTGDFL